MEPIRIGPLIASAAIDAANRRTSVRGAARRSCCARARTSQPLSPTVRMLQPSRLPDARQRAPTYPHAAAVYEQLCNHVAADLVEDGKRQKRTSSKPRSCTDLGHCVTASQTVRKLALCCPGSPRDARSADPRGFLIRPFYHEGFTAPVRVEHLSVGPISDVLTHCVCTCSAS